MKEKEKYIEDFNEEELESSFDDLEEEEEELDEVSIEEYSKEYEYSEDDDEIHSLEDQSFDDLLTPEEVYFSTDMQDGLVYVVMTPIKYYTRTGHVSDWELTDLLPEEAIEGFMEETEGTFACEDEDLSEKEIKSILKSRGFVYKKSL